jgi:CRP-like cAMP-binding protein
MDLQTFLMRSPALHDKASATRFVACWTPKLVKKGTPFVVQGDHETKEHILLEGSVASRIHDPDGAAVCVGLFIGPSVITPNIARTRDGISRVSLEAVTDTLVAQMDSALLTEMMIESEPIRDWANGVLREELDRKADREWCLAALGGSDRLAWFRERYPDYEDKFVHSLIASFLGVTPVTLSRLRSGGRIT